MYEYISKHCVFEQTIIFSHRINIQYCLFATLLIKWYELTLQSTRIQVTINYDNDDICLIKVVQSLLANKPGWYNLESLQTKLLNTE